MSNGANLLEPEPRKKHRGEETTQIFWKPSLPEVTEPRYAPRPRSASSAPYLLAPHPWPQGQFRIDPEA
jgi:hypothetical protein